MRLYMAARSLSQRERLEREREGSTTKKSRHALESDVPAGDERPERFLFASSCRKFHGNDRRRIVFVDTEIQFFFYSLLSTASAIDTSEIIRKSRRCDFKSQSQKFSWPVKNPISLSLSTKKSLQRQQQQQVLSVYSEKRRNIHRRERRDGR